MKQMRKIYDRIFKEKTVELSYERHNISELARELGIIALQLYNWRKELEEFRRRSFPDNGKLKKIREQEHIAELEKKIRETEL
jgi:transposase